MNRIKSLRTIKFILPVVAVILIVFAGFAFKSHRNYAVPAVDQEVWLHYDCDQNGEVLEEPNNIEPANTPNPFGCSGTKGAICAVKYLLSDLQETSPGSNIYKPKPGATQMDIIRCEP